MKTLQYVQFSREFGVVGWVNLARVRSRGVTSFLNK